MPGRADGVCCALAVALVVLIPLLGMASGGAFGFPGSAVWALVVGPVLLALLARGGGDSGEPDA